eukprot:403349857
MQYFSFQITNNYHPGDDVIVKIVPLEYQCRPLVYISKVNFQFIQFFVKTDNHPTNLTADWSCGSFAQDACFIHAQNVSMNDMFYISISCYNADCNLDVTVEATSEFTLEDGEEFQTYLIDQDVRIFNYQIPVDIQDDSSIVIKASSYRGSSRNFKMKVISNQKDLEINNSSQIDISKGQSKSNIIVGKQAWKKGQVARISKENFNGWCLGCFIQIMLDVYDQGYYHVVASSEDAQPFLYSQEQKDDIVAKNKRVCYRYYIKSENTDIQVRITTYSGLIDLVAHPTKMPASKIDFKYKKLNEIDSVLNIPHDKRSKVGEEAKGLYFICVYGDQFSSYSIKVKEFDPTDTLSIIQDGFSEEFSMQNQSTHIHLYQVPKLTYKDEDIKIEFDLTPIRGGDPMFGAKFCESVRNENCSSDFKLEEFMTKNGKYMKGVSTGQMQKIVIDHKEEYCDVKLEGEDCYYQLIVYNPQYLSQKLTYKLVASHTQNNHKILQESHPTVDSVEINEYQYYQFSLLDDKGVSSVQISLTQLHGNSDLYVTSSFAIENITLNTESYQWPTKTKNIFKSQKIGTEHDVIEIKKGQSLFTQTSIAGVYYIGVYGQSYSTYSLLVTVNYFHSTDLDKLMTKSVNLFEGVPINHKFVNPTEQFYSHFTVDIDEEDDISIVIDMQNSAHKSITYLKYDSLPTLLDYDILIKEGSYFILPNDTNYHRVGNYFLMTIPNTNYTKMNINGDYKFTLQWRYEDQIPHLNSNGKTTVSQDFKEMTYFKHYVMDQTQDIRLSIHSKTSDKTKLYVSVHPSNPHPTKESHDFTIKTGKYYDTAKQLTIKSTELLKANPSCSDLGYADNEICTLFIGVKCLEPEGCESNLEIDYIDKVPKKIHFGQSKFGVIESTDEIVYYYCVVEQNQVKDVFASLTLHQGNATVLVLNQNTFEDSQDTHNIQLPDLQQGIYSKKSRKELNNQVINIKSEEISKCMLQANQSENSNQFNDCLLVFAIIPDQNMTTEIIYDFEVQIGLQELKDFKQLSTKTPKDQYMYFLYELVCEKCSIHISIDAYRKDGLTILVNKGLKYPTLSDTQFSIKLYNQDSIEIKPTDNYFKENNITDMQDYYIIGVYSDSQRSISITVSSYSQQSVSLQPNTPTIYSQDPKTIKMFTLFNWQQFDLIIDAEVISGEIDIYAKMVFERDSDEEEAYDYSKFNATLFTFESKQVNSLTQKEQREIIILHKDRNYCSQCYLQIAVETFQAKSQYQLEVKQVQSESLISSLLRLNIQQTLDIQKDEVKVFEFMIEQDAPFIITPLLLHGSVMIYISLENDIEKAYFTMQNPQFITISTDQFKTDQLQYLFIKGITESAKLQLKLSQDQEIIQLRENTAQAISFRGENDLSKYLTYNLPIGDSEVRINIHTNTFGFIPTLFYSVTNHSMVNQGNFPPNALIKYNSTSYEHWDPDTLQLSLVLEFKGLKVSQILAMNMKYVNDYSAHSSFPIPSLIKNQTSQQGQVIMTISHTNLARLHKNQEYLYKLYDSNPLYYRIDAVPNNTILIQLSECFGTVGISVVRNITDVKGSRLDVLVEQIYGQKVIRIKNAVGSYFVVVQSYDPFIEQIADLYTEFSIKYKYLENKDIQENIEYVPMDGGLINYEYLKGTKGNVNITWGHVYQIQVGQAPTIAHDVMYKLVFTKNKRAVMNHICTLKHIENVMLASEQIDVINYYETKLTEGDQYQFNVFALMQNQMAIIPYTPISLQVPASKLFGSVYVGLIICAIILITVSVAVYFYKRSKVLQERINEEIRDFKTEQSSTGKQEESNSQGGRTKYYKVGGATAAGGFQQLDETEITKMDEQP